MVTHAAATDTRSSQYQELKGRIHQEVLSRLNLDRLNQTSRVDAEPEIRVVIQDLLDRENQRVPLSLFDRESIIEDVLDELFGLGPLEALLKDPSISDILVNKASQVFIEREGRIEDTDIVFRDDRHLMQIIERIVSAVGRRIDESTPMVDARLKDGSRVNVIIPPLALDGPAMSIRRFRTDKLGADDLVERESLTRPMLDFLRGAVAARLNILVSGGTGAGKTTLLNILSGFIHDGERIVTIEDAAELQLKQPHVARLETRPPNIEGKNAIRQRELLVNALRMRPDRIVIGECRGEETLDMLQAMNTGHDGSMTTLHANTPRDAISRMEVMVTLGSSNMPIVAIRQQIAAAVDLIVQVTRMSDGTRRCRSLTEVTTMEGDQVMLQDLFVFEKRGVSAAGKILGRFAATGIRPRFYEKIVAAGMRIEPEVFEEVVEIGE
jgi:pilus assembly protein CpaF